MVFRIFGSHWRNPRLPTSSLLMNALNPPWVWNAAMSKLVIRSITRTARVTNWNSMCSLNDHLYDTRSFHFWSCFLLDSFRFDFHFVLHSFCRTGLCDFIMICHISLNSNTRPTRNNFLRKRGETETYGDMFLAFPVPVDNFQERFHHTTGHQCFSAWKIPDMVKLGELHTTDTTVSLLLTSSKWWGVHEQKTYRFHSLRGDTEMKTKQLRKAVETARTLDLKREMQIILIPFCKGSNSLLTIQTDTNLSQNKTLTNHVLYTATH